VVVEEVGVVEVDIQGEGEVGAEVAEGDSRVGVNKPMREPL